MSVPKYFEMHKPILQFLSDQKIHTLKEIKQYVAKEFKLTEGDMEEMLPSGRQTYFSNRVGWARTYLKKAGLIDSPAKASFRITTEGQAVLVENPPVIDNHFLSRYESFREFTRPTMSEDTQAQENGQNENDSETPDDIFENAFEKINQGLADDILTEVMKLTPVAFERLVLDLMKKMGYGTFPNAAAMTATTGDEGIDGIIMEDKLGFDLIYVQVKRWDPEHIVGRPDVQAFVGAIAGKGGKGLFVQKL